ncbi:YncE family protein [Pseudomonas veronii]|uniref:YncE family protein n=1 Tax=Pseudomonas veronii TaxID=76761 RepID=A0A7Y0ZU16_PSEVE|nr:YncE family protein [Pseudomonas veronii]NMX41814.1 YncE family protein [Pseudomonas veronii]NMX98023.1 YncE family protein [Pseudomonas veronii]CAD0260439.1 NHL repeat family protein [Pseudomonas veronii]SEC05715.1 DNA-binding beta-propeller fold protein YncE [Pseudomonas marginalis]
MATDSDDQALIPADNALPVLPYDPPSDEFSAREPDEPRSEGFTLPQVDGSTLTPQSFRQTPFADLPLYLPTLSTPVVSFDGGLNRAALEVNEKGVTCILFSYLNQAENDFIELMLNDERVVFHTVTEDEALKGTQIVLYVPSKHFISEAGNALQAFVTPLGGNTQQTKRFNIKVDIEHPGGRDPIASTWQNENLPKPIFPDDVIQFGVDSDTAGKGVPVIIDYYPVDSSAPVANRRKVRDRIRLSIGGVVVEHRVSEFEAAGTAPITIWVYANTWATVGSGVKICEYNLFDEVGNASLGFSPEQELTVRLDDGAQPLLREAYIDEAEQDPDGNDQLDADGLGGEPATIIVPVRNEGYISGDTIRVRVNGLTAEGIRIITFYDFPVVSPTIVTAKIPWPFADILPLVNGRIQLTYQRIRTGVLPRDSRGANVNIVGTPGEVGLAAPIVEAAMGGTLPDPTVNPFEVLIKTYPGQLSNDRVTLVLEGTFANGRSYYAEYSDMAGIGDIYFDLPNGPGGPIAQLEGGSLITYYKVNNRPPSRRLELSIGETQASLRAPTTRQAVPPNHVFDPLVSKANLNVTVHHHASFVLNAVVTLHFEGSKAGGSNPPIAFLIDSNWLGADLPFTIPRTIVLNNLNGSARLYYTVDAPGQPRQLISHDLVITIGSALELPEPVVLESTPIKPPSLASINPLHVLPPRPAVVTVRVTYAMLASDNVKVHIIGESGTGIGTPNIPMKPGIPDAGEEYITFTTSNVFVGANLGRKCRVFFEVTRDNAITQSRELTLEVEELPEQEFELVSIPEASGGAINTAVANNVRIDKWPFFRAGQPVWIQLLSTTNRDLRLAVGVTSAEFNAGRTLDLIPASYLSGLENNSEVAVKAWVSLDGSNSLETAKYFKVPTYVTRKGSGEIIRHITVGNGPNQIAISRDGNTVCVLNARAYSVSVINFASGAIRTLAYNYVYRLALHPTEPRLFLSANTGLGANYQAPVLNLSTFTFSYPFAFSYSAAYAIGINPTGSRMFIGLLASGSSLAFSVFDTTSGQYVTNFGGTAGPRAIVTNPQGTAIFTTGYNTERYTLSSGVRTHTVVNGAVAQELAHTGFDAPLERLYVSVSGLNKLDIYNTENDSLTFIKSLTGLSDPRGIAFHPTRPLAYVSELAGNRVRVIDMNSETLIGTINGFDQPNGLACTPDGQYLLVCNSGNTTVAVVSI